MKTQWFALAALILIIFTALSEAQIPRTLSYQGVLTDNVGRPRSDGSYSFTFRFYISPTGGTAIWSESKSLSVKNGLFSTALGEQIPFGAAVKFDQQYWLGIQVSNDPELSPRIALTSVGIQLQRVARGYGESVGGFTGGYDVEAQWLQYLSARRERWYWDHAPRTKNNTQWRFPGAWFCIYIWRISKIC